MTGVHGALYPRREDTVDFCSRLLLLRDVALLPSPCTYPQVENRRNKKQKQKKQTQSALKHRLLSPWLARVGHGAAGTMAGDASAGSGHLAPAWHELEASKERRAQDRSCWHAGKAPACPVHLVAPLGVRDVRFHRLLCVRALLRAVDGTQVPVPSCPLLAPGALSHRGR